MSLYFAKLTFLKGKIIIYNHLKKKKPLEQRTFDHATTYAQTLKRLMVFKNGEL